LRIYEGSPRQNYEEVLRSIGAFVDRHGMREVLVLEAPDGFILQGLAIRAVAAGSSSEHMGQQAKETFSFLDEDVAGFIEQSQARRAARARAVAPSEAGYYEHAFRVIGRYIDDQEPRDIFFFEQDRAFVLRLLMAPQAGSRHVIAEFTAKEVETMIADAPWLRGKKGS